MLSESNYWLNAMLSSTSLREVASHRRLTKSLRGLTRITQFAYALVDLLAYVHNCKDQSEGGDWPPGGIWGPRAGD